MNKKLMGVLLAAGLGLSGSLAQASAILGFGGKIFATGGNVQVDILPSESGFNNQIGLFYSFTDANHNLSDFTFIGIDNYASSVNLGFFDAGQELVFGILSPDGDFVLGDGSRNLDNLVHGWVSSATASNGFAEAWDVGFEDLWLGGDKDYNDAIFRVSQGVPEPASVALIAVGLVGLGLSRRKARSC